MTAAVAEAHVAASFVYGPVASRRFGRSLGICVDDPSSWSCAWRCPYCQVGHLPRRRTFPPPAAILAELERRLAALPDLDACCIAGNGEPTDHPGFAAIAGGVAAACAARGVRTVLLTNGDGLIADPAKDAATDLLDEVWIKYDPGPADGSWRQGPRGRRARLAARAELRIQALLFATARGPGNAGARALERWSRTLAELRPAAVALTTVARRPAGAGCVPLARDRLRTIARDLAAEIRVPVRCG